MRLLVCLFLRWPAGDCECNLSAFLPMSLPAMIMQWIYAPTFLRACGHWGSVGLVVAMMPGALGWLPVDATAGWSQWVKLLVRIPVKPRGVALPSWVNPRVLTGWQSVGQVAALCVCRAG
jgi:hypothetical protein